MNTEQETNTRVEESELNLGDILQTVLANWYWFVLSVVVCAGAAFLYLKWAPKVYTRTASVLIKDDAKGGAMSESAAFEDLGLFGTKRNVDNEVLVFKSRRLMTEVARNLHLDVSYTVKDGLRTVELYTQSPVQLSFPDAEEAQAFSLQAVPVSGKEVMLSGFTLGDQEVSDGKPMKDKNGKVIYEPYQIKVLNTINFAKSMHYNPFAYIHSEKDILKLVTTLSAGWWWSRRFITATSISIRPCR